MITAADDTTIRRWDATSGDLISVLRSHSGPVRHLAVFNALLISGSEDAIINIRKLSTNQRHHAMQGHRSALTCTLVVEPVLYSGSKDMTIMQWDLSSGTILCLMVGHTDCVTCLAFVQGTLFSGCRDGSIKQWDPLSGALLATLEGHMGGINCMLVVEGTLVSGSADRTVRQWDPRTCQPMHIMDARSTGITCLLDGGCAVFGGMARGFPVRFTLPRMFGGAKGDGQPVCALVSRSHVKSWCDANNVCSFGGSIPDGSSPDVRVHFENNGSEGSNETTDLLRDEGMLLEMEDTHEAELEIEWQADEMQGLERDTEHVGDGDLCLSFRRKHRGVEELAY